MDDIERALLIKNEVFVYKIPPRASAKGYRAADWKLDAPDWTGRLRCIEKGGKCELRMEDKMSGQLFAACPVDNYPGVAVEAVTDSSRYFVLCIQDSGRKAYIGIGFADRSDSFDLNVTLQDHFKQLKKENQFTKEATEPTRPNLDLAFKEGQTIRINIPSKTGEAKGGGAISRPKGATAKGSMGGIVLPPPPGGASAAGRLPTSVSGGNLALNNDSSVMRPQEKPDKVQSSNSLLNLEPAVDNLLLSDLDFGPTEPTPAPLAPLSSLSLNPSQTQSTGFSNSDFDDWGDFATPSKPGSTAASSGNWEQF